MKVHPNFKAIKSTILGTFLIGLAVFFLIENYNISIYFNGGLIVAGVMLWFAPDRFINLLETKILGKEIKFGKKDEDPVV